MADFVDVIAVSDLAPGSGMEATVGTRAVALFNVAGAFYAIGNVCVHRGGPLGQGFVEGTVVSCPWHAWNYDVTTGMSTVNPALSVAKYEVKVESGRVFVRVE